MSHDVCMPRIAVANEFDWPLRRHYDLNRGIEHFAEEQGDWELEIGPYPDLRMKHGRRFDGIVGRICPQIRAAAAAARIPVVNVWQNSPIARKVASVFVDSEQAGRMAVEHLHARGLRRFVSFSVRGRSAQTKFLRGITRTTAALACPHVRQQVADDIGASRSSWERFFLAVSEAVKSWQAPLGVIVSNDGCARQLVEELRDLAWSVPEQVAIVSLGNDSMYCNAYPSLSSIDMGYQVCGYEAAGLLAALMRGEPAPSSPIVTPPKELLLRQSSDVFAVNNAQVANALRFMIDNSHTPISVPDIAAHAGISRQSLGVQFQRHVGHSINQELTRLRVEHLKRLLVELDEPLKDIGLRAGLATESQFYRTFKAATGMTPSEYRRAHSLGMPKA
jgi:LacI family transcriptional regulator